MDRCSLLLYLDLVREFRSAGPFARSSGLKRAGGTRMFCPIARPPLRNVQRTLVPASLRPRVVAAPVEPVTYPAFGMRNFSPRTELAEGLEHFVPS